ncbi:hypothetical protein HPB47_003393 [Ixodes persulcatus]|uniref:Uncharacterized protein n=1 Tax=Ixodes persulcatus TaxID=34615 RepID=A0AC60PJK7_IXOPE|nr:hypothetical protein HPB47_003393 [Ixodes persulcatus]
MTSRLDRLFLLLDTGSSPVTRRAAALQLGEVQRLHPHELHHLLAKVRKYLHSACWDTRIAGSQAVEAIVSQVPQWDPPANEKGIPGAEGTACRLRFAHFDIRMVMRHGADLLASEGSEFDLEEDPLVGQSKEMLAHQRRLLHQRLGLEGAERMGLLDSSELFSAEDLRGDGCSRSNAEHPVSDKRDLAEMLAQQGSTGAQKRRASAAAEAGPTKRPAGSVKEEPREPGENFWDEGGEWPLEAFTESLCQDLFSASWEVRHGAATALREIVRLHGRGAGRCCRMTREQMEAANQLFLEDLSLRLLCVLALDKFGDFVSDQVVAPVRETCAQCLGHILSLAGEAVSSGVLGVLLVLLRCPQWEARHGGLLGLKYLLAVRKDASLLMPSVFEPIFGGLQDPNDDVSAVAAAALLPVTDHLASTLPHQVPRVLRALWDSLLELDELTSSTSCILRLLAALLSQEKGVARMGEEQLPLEQCLPRLWGFLSHNSGLVRQSVLRSLLVLTSKEEGHQPPSNWLPPVLSDMLRLLLQRCLVENCPDTLQLIYQVWSQLVSTAPLGPLLTAACPCLGSWLCLLMHPAHLQVDVVALQWLVLPPKIKGEKRGRRVSDPPALEQPVYIGGAESLGDPPQERERLVLQCRLMAARLLGLLSGPVTRPMPGLEQPPPPSESPVECYARLLLFHLGSKSALQRTMAAQVLAHWVRTDEGHECPASVRDRVLECLGESIYFDEMAGAFTRLQQDCRDFMALLRHAGLPLDACFQPGAVLTVDQASHLATSVFQTLMEQAEQGVAKSLEEKRQCLLQTALQTGRDQLQLSTMVQSSLAGFLVSLGQLPERLNPVIRPLMDAVRREANHQLQRQSCERLVELLGRCVSREPCPNGKVVRNLVALLCSPHPDEPADARLPGILTLDNMHKQVERSSLRRSLSRKGSVQAVSEDSTGADEGVQRRGAVTALSLATESFGANLPERLPSLWEAAFHPLSQDAIRAADAAALSTSLQLLEVVGPSLHPNLSPQLESVLGPLCSALEHGSPWVRHLSSRCLGMLARVCTGPTMSLVTGRLLAQLGASHDPILRQGALEALACVIESLGLLVVPYIVLLLVPVLGRMSDPDPQVRLMATHCFAALVRLMPLDGGVGEGPDLPEELRERRASEKHFLEQLMNAKHADNFEVPVPIGAQLRSYQQEGVNWLAFLNKYRLHGILCDDMGLGKTLQSICILASDHHLREQQYQEGERPDAKPLPSLVVCPPTLTGHWVYEVEKFVSSRYLNPLHYTGPPTERLRLQGRAHKHNLVVASYDIVRNDIDFFGAISWNYCILDEGHIIKNGRTKLARAMKQLQANHRLILTGTPIQNQVLDLWSLFDFLMPGFLGTERQFAARFSKPILQSRDAKSSSKEQEAGVLAMESLHRQVLPFLLRRVKEDVLQDLPPKILQDYYCELSPLQVQLYEDFARSRAKKSLDETVEAGGDGSHAMPHVFQALQYLRKVCNHPKLVLNAQHPEYERIHASLEQNKTPLSDIGHAAKLGALRQLLLDCGIGSSSGGEQESVVHAHRALVFCQLKSMLDIVERDLLRAHMPGVSYLRLDGSVAPGQRHALVHRFNTDPSMDVLLLTTQVGGLGLNLTGADTVIFVEHDWNPMKDLQAMDRAHRIGQKKVVNVYRLITRGTLEEKIMGLQKFKLTVANTVITPENSSLQTMGTDQLLDLFTLNPAAQSPTPSGDTEGGPRGLSLPELWDSAKYDSEYDLTNFLNTLRPK